LEFVLSVEHDPCNRDYIFVWTHQQHLASLSDADMLHLIIEDHNQASLGYVILAGLLSPHSSIEFRRIVVKEKGLGIGRSALRAVKALAFEELQAHRLWLDVKEHNERAKALYSSEAFVGEGTLRECLQVDGARQSLVIMSMLRHEYSPS
jgi:RimJ/RimL family protein N-acetyltransferase